MALNKPVATPYGVEATYHRIVAVQTHFPDRCADVVLASYLGPDARADARQPLGVIQTRIGFESMALASDGEVTRAVLYAALKATPDWQDAADC